MEKYTYNGEDFKSVISNDNWKIGLLRYSERFSCVSCFERHLKTDEAFILLYGDAVLYIKNQDGTVEETKMEPNTIYNVLKGEWHHIVVSRDATVLVVENSDTSKENTEKVTI
jgi:hypothetical protein